LLSTHNIPKRIMSKCFGFKGLSTTTAMSKYSAFNRGP